MPLPEGRLLSRLRFPSGRHATPRAGFSVGRHGRLSAGRWLPATRLWMLKLVEVLLTFWFRPGAAGPHSGRL